MIQLWAPHVSNHFAERVLQEPDSISGRNVRQKSKPAATPFLLLNSLNHTLLAREARLFKQEAKADSKEDVDLSPSALDTPLATSSPVLINNMVKYAASKRSYLLETAHTARLQRQCVMRSHIHVWKWIHEIIPRLVQDCLSGIADPNRGVWVDALSEEIHTMLLLRKTHIIIDGTANPALADLSSRQFVYRNSHARRLYLSKEESTVSQVISDVQAAVKIALGYPSTCGITSAYVFGALEDACGPEILLIETVWESFINFVPRRFVRGSGSPVEQLTSFRQSLETHDICTAGTLANSSLMELKMAANGTPCELPGWKQVHMLLRVGLSFAGERVDDLSPMEDKLLSWTREDPLRYLALRELLPERQRGANTGPFRTPVINTKEGLFSAMIWRVLTIGTPFNDSGPYIFESYSDFEAMKDLRRLAYPIESSQSNYFVNLKAYGSLAVGRSRISGREYWEKVCELEEEWVGLTESGNASFTECLDFLRPRTNKTGRFPQLGDLGAYLLSCDMSYAGACLPPTRREVARCIVTMDKGSMRGLEYLDLVHGGGREEKMNAVEGALETVKNWIDDKFTCSDQHTMILDYICIEHLLCKLQRHRNSIRV